jgi:capsular polysaccharide biosynthesis protein
MISNASGSHEVKLFERLSRWNSDAVLKEFDEIDYTPFPREIRRVVNVRMLRSGILTKNFRTLAGSAHPALRYQVQMPLRLAKSLIFEQSQKLPEGQVYAVCHCDWSSGYFHWITEVLPRMISVREAYPEAILVRPYYSAIAEVIQSSVQRLAFAGEVQAPMLRPLQIPEVCFRSVPWPMGAYHPADIEAIRTVMLQGGNNGRSTRKRIYVSRRGAAYRHIENESEIIETVTRRGFEVIHAENLSFVQQVSLFSQADALISIHGAGLTNMIWMPPGSSVIEFIKLPERSDHSKARGTKKLNPSYPRMAALIDHRYTALICDPVIPNLPAKFANIRVDVAQLEAAMNRVGL